MLVYLYTILRFQYGIPCKTPFSTSLAKQASSTSDSKSIWNTLEFLWYVIHNLYNLCKSFVPLMVSISTKLSLNQVNLIAPQIFVFCFFYLIPFFVYFAFCLNQIDFISYSFFQFVCDAIYRS